MPRFCANLTMLFTEFDFFDQFEQAALAGFKAVEILFPYGLDVQRIADELGKHKLELILIDLPAGNWKRGDRGIAGDPGRIGAFQDSVGEAIEHAKALGCKQCNCLAGLVPNGVSKLKAQEVFVDNLKFAAHAFARESLSVLLEPINTRDLPGFLLCGTDQTIDIISKTGAANITMQYDVYHMQIMEGDIARTINRHLGHIGHIQISDVPDRHEPGTGEICFKFLFEHLDRIGYDGWVGLEYSPIKTTQAGLGFIKPYLHSEKSNQ